MKRFANHSARRALTDSLRHQLQDGESARLLLLDRPGVSPKTLRQLRTTIRVTPRQNQQVKP
ncbi:hypothetical protein SAMN05216456_1932 [Devosia crocina]|uniref:Uncharacterized protein n=1 Tax=Devosia crocina TaxID=429728 RepID=A0A1I7NEZ1_9HYPH|nr:hypothetical protein [Devosia crocina]SFV33247.1 hypothetical protein SAMN05216456_1932 [Devosia crocina]